MTIKVSLQKIALNKARPSTPHILRWELFYGAAKPKKFTFSCDDRPTLVAFRERIAGALEQNQTFILSTGLPLGLSRPPTRVHPGRTAGHDVSAVAIQPIADHPALYDVAANLHERWKTGAGNTLRGDVDGLKMTFEVLRPGAPDLDAAELKALRAWVADMLTPPDVRQRLAGQQRSAVETARADRAPGAELTTSQRRRQARTDAGREARVLEAAAAAAQWRTFYDQHGLRWSDIDEATVLRILARLRKRVDGGDAAHNTAARRAITANAMLEWAVRRDLMTMNPIRTLEKHQRVSTTIRIRPVDLRLVVSISTLIQIVDTCKRLGREGDDTARRLVPFFALVAFGMTRPAEARRAVAEDFRALVAGKWGLLVLHGSVASVGRRYSPDGKVDEVRGLKHRGTDATRPVRIPPYAVACVVELFKASGLKGSQPLFVNADGSLINPGQIYAVWDRIKAVVFADDDTRRKELDVYDLRHARFSHLLAAGEIPDPDVAAWGGNSVNTMRATYQGVISAGTGEGATWLTDLEQYYDEIVPPDMQRRNVSTAALLQHVQRMADITARVVSGDAEAVGEMIAEAQRALLPATRTVGSHLGGSPAGADPGGVVAVARQLSGRSDEPVRQGAPRRARPVRRDDPRHV